VPVSRRLSLDTQRAEKAGKRQGGGVEAGKKEPRRRSSIEVGTLSAGHLGSMIGMMESTLFTILQIQSISLVG
jgi:hypothetical protein